MNLDENCAEFAHYVSSCDRNVLQNVPHDWNGSKQQETSNVSLFNCLLRPRFWFNAINGVLSNQFRICTTKDGHILLASKAPLDYCRSTIRFIWRSELSFGGFSWGISYYGAIEIWRLMNLEELWQCKTQYEKGFIIRMYCDNEGVYKPLIGCVKRDWRKWYLKIDWTRTHISDKNTLLNQQSMYPSVIIRLNSELSKIFTLQDNSIVL